LSRVLACYDLDGRYLHFFFPLGHQWRYFPKRCEYCKALESLATAQATCVVIE